MIYLITGKPGSGKTLHMMSMLLKRKDLKGRPLYLDGIPDVDLNKIPHEPLPENCDGSNWQEWLPQNAILVVDECQRYWRPRANGSKVPLAIQEMETHRRRGVDIFLITQHPRLIDINIKSFVENHKHLDKTQLGTRRMWEWQRCGNPDNKGDIADAQNHVYMLDKDAFDVYKSAEIHTKIKVNRSKWVYIFPVVLVAAISISIYAFQYNKKLLSGQQVAKATDHTAETVEGGAKATPNNVDSGVYGGNVQPNEPIKPVLKQDDFIPALDGKPWTAPIYFPMNTQIKTMPFPVGCVKNGDKCTCYTDQATPIRGLDNGLCLDFVENGIYNPYLEKQVAVNQNTPDPTLIN